MQNLPSVGKFHGSLSEFVEGNALGLAANGFKIGNARQPLALTLPLRTGTSARPDRQLEIQGTSIARHDEGA